MVFVFLVKCKSVKKEFRTKNNGAISGQQLAISRKKLGAES